MPFYSANEILPSRDYETKKTTKKICKNKNFTAKTEYLNLKAYSNNVKMQSDKTIDTQT